MKRRLVFTTLIMVSSMAFGENGGRVTATSMDQLVGMVMDASRNQQKVFVEEFTGIN